MPVPYKPKGKKNRQKKGSHEPLMQYLEKEKKLLGKPLLSSNPSWDSIF